MFNGEEALPLFMRDVGIPARVLDIGCGGNVKPMLHTPVMRRKGVTVDALDMSAKRANIHCRFEDFDCESETYDGVWASHMLEHAENVGDFLTKCRLICKRGGVFAVTVPSVATNFGMLVPGHLTLWNPALLCYNLIVAGWDLRHARLGTYGKNISVVVRRLDAPLPNLHSCRGDIELLREFFPVPVSHGCSAQFTNTRWK